MRRACLRWRWQGPPRRERLLPGQRKGRQRLPLYGRLIVSMLARFPAPPVGGWQIDFGCRTLPTYTGYGAPKREYNHKGPTGIKGARPARAGIRADGFPIGSPASVPGSTNTPSERVVFIPEGLAQILTSQVQNVGACGSESPTAEDRTRAAAAGLLDEALRTPADARGRPRIPCGLGIFSQQGVHSKNARIRGNELRAGCRRSRRRRSR